TYLDAYDDERVGTYELHLRPGQDVAAARKEIYRRFGARYNLFVLTNKELRADVRGRTDQVFSLLRALEFVALIVAVLGILNAQLANVLDRVRELGVLRALGMSRRSASRMVLIEGVLIGALGLLCGMLVGGALSYIMLRYINLTSTGWYFPFDVSPVSLLELSALTLCVAALAGFYPAKRAASLVITEALGYE
ncbi:MAG TPA: ABC transporter permease, partial [Polyangiaceae bacterium]|nr:ABC transporter permease [Polyangiaceae bacterium]